MINTTNKQFRNKWKVDVNHTCISNGRDKAEIGMSQEIHGEINTLLINAQSDGKNGKNFAKFLTSCGSVTEAELALKTLSHQTKETKENF